MYLTHLTLRQFRNYQEQAISFHPHLNIVSGKNAQGKTNLLEAIYYMGFLNSFRSSSHKELIAEGQPQAFIKALFNRDGVDHDIGIYIEPTRRQIKWNGKNPSPIGSYYGFIPILLFEPKDVYLLRESPSKRRKYINRAVFLERSSILKVIQDYEAVVMQKNKLLKLPMAFSSKKLELEVWNAKLKQLGAVIMKERVEWIKNLSKVITSEYRKLSQGNEELNLVYEDSLGLGKILEDMNISNLEVALANQLDQKKIEERDRCESLVGPHRDDWQILLDGREIGVKGSQGENRTAMVALKASQVQRCELRHGIAPVFLLDDVASELDIYRAMALTNYLKATPSQVFMTTTEMDTLAKDFKQLGSSFMVEGGRVRMVA